MSNKNRVLPNVSILTPKFRRIEFLPVLADCIIQQNYPMNKLEWVIVDGENDPNKFNDVPAKILEIKDRFKTIPKIVFHHSPMHQNNLIIKTHIIKESYLIRLIGFMEEKNHNMTLNIRLIIIIK